MKRLASLAAIAAATLIAGCGGPALHGGRPHSAQFLQQAQHAHLPAPAPLLTATPAIPGYDAVTLSSVPANAQAVGCYATGTYANCNEARSRFPHAHIVSITPTASFVPAKCLDTEPGDSTPDQVAGWIRADQRAGVKHPCDYADASEMVTVKADVAAAGIARSDWLAWVAAWNGSPAIPAGDDAHQWFSDAAIDKDTFSAAFFVTAKPPLRCFHHGWSHNATCNRVRHQAAVLGQTVSRENAYLKVTQKNIARIQGRLGPLQRQLAAIDARATTELQQHQWAALQVSAANANRLEPRLGPLQRQLAPIQARASLEQHKAAAANSQLQALLKKYGW